jgi:hypothetical protein
MSNTIQHKMRVYHRYLGYFLAGIMAVYSISGIILIFRETDFLKKEKQIEKKLQPHITNSEELGKELKIKGLKIDQEDSAVIFFKQGIYNKVTGVANYKLKVLPIVIEKMTKLHKATTKEPLFYLNIFFGLSLLFFVLSSFWMYLPKTTIFKKGLYFTLAGIVLTILLLLY